MQDSIPAEEWLDTKETAEYLKVIAAATLVSWRSRGISPIPFYRIAGRILYKRSEIDAYRETGRVVQNGGYDE